MAKTLLILLLLTTLAACNEAAQKPSGMLPDEEMVEVLVALHLAEARADLLLIPRDSITPLLEARYAEIFAEKNIDSAAFNRSFAYYERNPEQMDSLYQKVIDNLVENEAKYRADTTIADTMVEMIDTILDTPMPIDSLPRRR